jgi:hypothetical protein
LDFEEPAGIDSRSDSIEIQAAKLDTYERLRSRYDTRLSYFLCGCALGATAIRFWPQLWPF